MKIKLLQLIYMTAKYSTYVLTMQLLTIGLISATDSEAQYSSVKETKLSITIENKTVIESFKLIESKTDFNFYYNKGDLNRKIKINLSGTHTSVADILLEISRQTKLKFRQVNNTIAVSKIIPSELEEGELVEVIIVEDFDVLGKVTDEEGEPLPGVSVVIEGTNTGSITDAEGNYRISVPDNDAVLIYTYVGMLTQRIPVGNRTLIDVKLQTDVSLLSEVVVVAYGTQKRSTITSSITNIKSDELRDVTVPDVSSMIQGKAAGVQVAATSGRPGSVPEIIIRGMASLNGSVRPLWVIDGVIQPEIQDFGDGPQAVTPVINPNDIESVSILKDASATTLYGSRGANGVIIVTTKRGETGTSQLSFSSKVGFNKINDGNFRVMNSQEFYDYHLELNNQQTWFTPDLLNRDTDWLDLGTQTGIVQDYNVSYSAGSEKLNVYMTGGYYDETGTVKGTDLERLTFRSNVDFVVNERLTLKPKISFSFDDRFLAEHPRYELYLNLPWDEPFDTNGNAVNAQASQDWLGRDQRNYFFNLERGNFGTSKVFNMSNNIDFEFEIMEDLSFISVNNFTLRNGRSFNYTDPGSTGGIATGGAISRSNSRRFTVLFTEMLRYHKQFGSNSVTVLGGFEWNEYESETLGAVGEGLISGGRILDATSTAASVEGNKNEYALSSLFLSADYSYEDRFFGKASIRRDGASNFGLDDQFAMFFALGAGWNIHNESFFNATTINELKLRVSYGSVGNRPLSFYPYQNTYTVNQQYDAVPAAVLSQLGNSDLTWERSFETNIAIDTRLLDRIDATFEYYNKNTSDLLWFTDLPAISGYNGFWENIGGLKNRGFEMALSAGIVETQSFNWNIGFNIGINRNKITELFDDQVEIPRGRKIFRVGEDLNSWYIQKWVGVDPENGDPLWEVVDETTGEISTTSDYNEATIQLVGTGTPDYIGGITSRVRYKNLSLNANFSFSQGGLAYNSSRELFDSDGFYTTFNQMILKDDWSRWENPGDEATHPLAVFGGNNNSNKPSSRYLEDRSFIKLRNVTLSYHFPQRVLDTIGIKGATAYISADNLLTFTDYSGFDPEIGGISGQTSLDYPVPRRLSLGLNFSL